MPDIKVNQAINRGNNMAITFFLVAVGIGVIGEIFFETEWIDRADDIVIVLLALIALVWYFNGNKRYKPSLVPFALTFVGLLVKIMALMIEFDDKGAVGDEFGLLLPFVFAVVISIILYIRARD